MGCDITLVGASLIVSIQRQKLPSMLQQPMQAE
jgi:hypothetical protein